MVSIQDLRKAYSETCVVSRVSLADGLKNVKGERLSALYGLIESLEREGSPFGVWLLHADGGVDSFVVTYRAVGYTVIVSPISRGQESHVPDNEDDLVKWFNKQERLIVAAMRLFVEEQSGE